MKQIVRLEVMKQVPMLLCNSIRCSCAAYVIIMKRKKL